ncbi:MAG: bifunctional hydroxymethylpyrimidine kinase/phosphomethylpyrimidine kinase [Oceanipulchritudo sp.]
MQSTGDMPVALAIAGSDSGGGAGVQADLLTMSANGVFGTTAITCLTAQNPDGVTKIQSLPAEFVHEQIEQVHRYFRIGAIKTGMLFNTEIVEIVADFLEKNDEIPAVIDPVMVATSGAVLLHESAIEALQLKLLPRAALITPNLDEAAVLLGEKPGTVEDMTTAADHLAGLMGVPVLLKGGHLEAAEEVVDILAVPGREPSAFSARRIENINTHGSGCTLSSAIAANLAKNWELTKAVGEALTYLRRGLRQPLYLNGIPFISH